MDVKGHFKRSIVNFKHMHLRLGSLEFLDAVSMTDFSLCEVLGTLPSLRLENLTLETYDCAYAFDRPRTPEDLNRVEVSGILML